MDGTNAVQYRTAQMSIDFSVDGFAAQKLHGLIKAGFSWRLNAADFWEKVMRGDVLPYIVILKSDYNHFAFSDPIN